MTLVQSALEYAAKGWRVLPIHTIRNGVCSCGKACGSPGKHPVAAFVPNGLKGASTNPVVIAEWWRHMPDANIGIATGRQSNLWVLDLDARRSIRLGEGVLVPEGEYSLKQLVLENRPLPPGPVVETGGGGRHYYYAYPDEPGIFGNKHNLAPSIDVRGEGGYVLAPPSLHPSGQQYRWEAGNEASNRLYPPPRWLYDLEPDFEMAGGTTFVEQDSVAEGGRNDYLFHYAASLRGQGYDEQMLGDAVAAHNEAVCIPPVTDAEVRQIVKSAMRYTPNPKPVELDIGPEAEEISPGSDLAIHVYDFLAKEITPPLPLVSAGMLDKGDGFILAGRSGVGKSWLAMDLAISIATGTKWLGEYPTSKGTVLYIDEEGSEWNDQERIAQLVAGRDWPMKPDMRLYLKIQSMLKLDDPKGLTTIQRMMERYRPDLLIFDTLARAHSGDENSTQEMAEFFHLSRSLRNAYDSAIAFLHHVRKPMKDDPGDECDMIRGSSDIRGWPDGILFVKEGKDPTQIIVNHCKSRNHRKNLPEFLVGLGVDNERGTAVLRYQGRKGDQRDHDSL